MNISSPSELQSLPMSALRVLRELRRKKSATRIQLAKITGFSSQTLTRISKNLLKRDLIREGEKQTGGRGQPAIYLSLKQDKLVSIGVVLEHDQITVVADDVNGDNIVRLKRRENFLSAHKSMLACAEMLNSAIVELGKNRIVLGVGISVSGFFCDDAGTICSRNDPAGWAKINIANELETRFKIPVFVANDGSAAAQGFALHGTGLNLHSFFLILITKGIGGGFYCDGRLISGMRGNAGEIAALLSSDVNAVRPTEESLQQYLQNFWTGPQNLWNVEEALQEKDPHLMEWLDKCAQSLLNTFNAIHSLFDPEAIVLSGRTPIQIRQALLDRIELRGPTYDGISPPQPKLLVDPTTKSLERGAVALPIAHVFDYPFYMNS